MKTLKIILVLIIILLVISWFFPIIPHTTQVECVLPPCPPINMPVTLKELLGI